MGVRIYNVSGSYPTLAKSGAAIYTFTPEPTGISFDYTKTIDYDDFPPTFLPEAWDSYLQDRNITISGSMTSSGSETLLTRMEKLDALSFYYTTFTNQPDYDSSDGTKIYALSIDFPTDSGVEEKIAFVVIKKQGYGLKTTYLTYTITFKEISLVDIS